MVSQHAVDIEVENPDSIEDLVEAIIKANNNLKDSTETSDFEMIGKDIQRLQELIDRLETLSEEKKAEENEIMTNELVNDTNSIMANAV